MRFGISLKVGRRGRVGVNVGGGRRPRLWASERIGPFRISESTSAGKRRKKR